MIRNGKMLIVSQLAGRLNALKKLKNLDFKSKRSITTTIIQSKKQYILPLYRGAPDYFILSQLPGLFRRPNETTINQGLECLGVQVKIGPITTIVCLVGHNYFVNV